MQNGMRDNATVSFNSGIGLIFAVKKYAEILMKIIEERDIKVRLALSVNLRIMCS